MLQPVVDLGRGLAQEGVDGLLDPHGMLDRQAAQRELADRFDVRSASELVSGPRGPASYASNQVTPEQFAAIARTYSDIRMGRTDLELDTTNMSAADAAKFRRETMADIGDVLQTSSGRDLIGALAHQEYGHHTQIHLHTDAAGNRDNGNAGGGAEAGSPDGSWSDGHGTAGAVWYVPGDQGGIRRGSQPNAFPKMRSDVTLFHELVHAHHATRGTLDTSTVIEHGRAVGGMEYQAADLGAWGGAHLTENAYRAERQAIGASGVGERTTGGPTDDEIRERSSYNPPPMSRRRR